MKTYDLTGKGELVIQAIRPRNTRKPWFRLRRLTRSVREHVREGFISDWFPLLAGVKWDQFNKNKQPASYVKRSNTGQQSSL